MLSPRESLLFEAGIKLGGVFHQYIGIPVSPSTAPALARAIEAAVSLQPFVRTVRVVVRPDRGPPLGRGRFAYRYLAPEMLEVTVVLTDGSVEVEARLEHRPDLRYSLMSVVRVAPRARRRTPARHGRRSPTYVALVDRDVRQVGRPNVLRRGADEPQVVVLLEDMSGPTRDPARGEERGEQVGRDAEQRADGSRVEVDVGVEALLAVHDLLDLPQKGVVEQVPPLLADLVGPVPEDRRPRVLDLVDAVAEPHDPLVAGELRLHDLFRALRGPDLREKLHDPFVGAAVEGSLEGPDRARDRAVEIAQGRRGDAGGERRRVELVVRVEDEHDVHRAGIELARFPAEERVEGVGGLG